MMAKLKSEVSIDFDILCGGTVSCELNSLIEIEVARSFHIGGRPRQGDGDNPLYLMYGIASIFANCLKHKMWSDLNLFVWQLWAFREGYGSIRRGGDHRTMSSAEEQQQRHVLIWLSH